MKPVGRNHPCPCGSGKKHKHCCLARHASPPLPFTSEERRSARVRLARFAERDEFETHRFEVQDKFWGDFLKDLPEGEAEEIFHLEQSQGAFADTLVFDTPIEGPRTLVELFLEREGPRLSSGEREYLERMRSTHWRLYEVAAVRPEEGLDLLDLLTGDRATVRERLATRQIVRWDVIAARLMRDASGDLVMDGTPFLYPAMVKEDMIKSLRRAHRRVTREFPGVSIDEVFRSSGAFFHQAWLVHVALRELPELITAEGDEVLFSRAFFDVVDRDRLEAALARHPDLVRQDDGSFAWLEPGDERRRALGTFVVRRGQLVLECLSRERAERGRALIEGAVGGAIRHRATTHQTAAQAMTEHARRPAPPAVEVPADVQAAVMADFYEQHYRRWPDTPLPALKGLTPRQAARRKAVRPQVISLLKTMENMAERQRREGIQAYDFGWMWPDLGLEREGSAGRVEADAPTAGGAAPPRRCAARRDSGGRRAARRRQ